MYLMVYIFAVAAICEIEAIKQPLLLNEGGRPVHGIIYQPVQQYGAFPGDARYSSAVADLSKQARPSGRYKLQYRRPAKDPSPVILIPYQSRANGNMRKRVYIPHINDGTQFVHQYGAFPGDAKRTSSVAGFTGIGPPGKFNSDISGVPITGKLTDSDAGAGRHKVHYVSLAGHESPGVVIPHQLGSMPEKLHLVDASNGKFDPALVIANRGIIQEGFKHAQHSGTFPGNAKDPSAATGLAGDAPLAKINQANSRVREGDQLTDSKNGAGIYSNPTGNTNPVSGFPHQRPGQSGSNGSNSKTTENHTGSTPRSGPTFLTNRGVKNEDVKSVQDNGDNSKKPFDTAGLTNVDELSVKVILGISQAPDTVADSDSDNGVGGFKSKLNYTASSGNGNQEFSYQRTSKSYNRNKSHSS